MPTLRETIRETATLLEQAGLADSARREAEWLAEGALGLCHEWRISESNRALPPAEAERVRAWTARRAAGEPLQYILGNVEFCGLRIEVGPGVLIPRPETEGLVELAMKAFSTFADIPALPLTTHDSPFTPPQLPVLDLCTGSGCVALALAQQLPQGTPVYAVDLSPDALGYARRNQAALGLHAVQFLEGDLYTPLPPGLRFAVITANPPYIAPPFYDQLPAEVKAHEPELALRADEDGLAVFRRIVEGARKRLLPGGRLLCELSSEQADSACNILARNGFTGGAFLPDCFGKPRFAVGHV